MYKIINYELQHVLKESTKSFTYARCWRNHFGI